MSALGPRTCAVLPMVLVLAAGCGSNVWVEGAPPGGDTGGAPGTGGAGPGGAGTGGWGPTTTSSSGTWTTTWTTTPTWTTTTPTTTTWTTTAVGCMELANEYEKALTVGAQCNACGPSDGCAPGVMYLNTCGCEVVLNSQNPAALANAKTAYWNWAGEGCPIDDCPCVPIPPGGGFCQSQGGGSCLGSCSF